MGQPLFSYLKNKINFTTENTKDGPAPKPALDHRRALVARSIFSFATVKDVPGHFVKHVVGLDTGFGLSGQRLNSKQPSSYPLTQPVLE